jgi:hypothetical protein
LTLQKIYDIIDIKRERRLINMTSDAIVEGLCGAISTIVSSALQDLSYDQTIICTIVDNSKSSNGEYRVTDGSIEFVAKSENTSY